MTTKLLQVLYRIHGLVPSDVRLKRRFWLKKGEILLEKKGESLNAYVLEKSGDGIDYEERLLQYLKFSPLITNNQIEIERQSGKVLKSVDEFGKDTTGHLIGIFSIGAYTAPAIADIEKHLPGFLSEIRRLHGLYAETVLENKFVSVALEFFYLANNKPTYSDEAFINAMICLEALYNEAPSDISYKIAHRAAFLLGLHNQDPVEVFSNLKSFYSDRSKLLHGRGALEDSGYNKRFKVGAYARRSIMIFLILLNSNKIKKISKNGRKESLLREIDNAMLDLEKREKLQKEISKGIEKFKLRIPRTFSGKSEEGDYRVTAW